MFKITKRELFQSTMFWIIVAAFFLSMMIIIFGGYMFESLKLLSMRLLISFSIFSVTLIALLGFKLYAKEDTQAKIKASKEQREKENMNSDAVSLKVKELKSRFIEATKIIRNSSVYKGKRDSKYELPWYLILGQEQEGKTALLESSGLDFPLNINYQNQDDYTTNADNSFQWYFAEHAIFVDIPGQFIKQEPGSIDAGVWRGFLHLFKKRRWKRPINGVVLVVSVETLMEKSGIELEQYAKLLRDRFDELSDAFTSTIPIYLLVTKTDRIPGFSEYFSTLSDNEKDEVLGMTFDDTQNIDSKSAQVEFDELLKRLNASVLDRIHNEWDHGARSKILLFSDEFALLFEKLKTFIDNGFAQTRYRAPLMLRGIYFTSIPAHNNVVSAVKDSLQANISAKGLFVRKVLQEIIFPEAYVIKMDSGHRLKERLRRRIGIASAVFITLLISLLWAWDYHTHMNTLDQLTNQLQEYQDMAKRDGESKDFTNRLALLNKVYSIKMIDDTDSSKYFWRLSYSSVQERQEKIESLYRQLLTTMLLPEIAKTLQSQTMNNLDNYDETWENTKAYLMLNLQEKRDNRFLAQWMKTIWARQYADEHSVQNHLSEHWQRLLAYGFKSYDIDQNTVQTARNKLAGYGQEALLYKQLKDKVEQMNLKEFHFADAMGANAALFSGTDYTIPGFYTREGYEKVFTLDAKTLLKEIIRSNWVLGYSTDLKDNELDVVYAKIQHYYFSDYKKIWMDALNTLAIQPDMTSEQIALLTSQDSPILFALKALKTNTDIYSLNELIEKKAQSAVASKTPRKITLNTNEALHSETPKTLREFFKPYNQLLTEEGAVGSTLQAEMTRYNNSFNASAEGADTPADAFATLAKRANKQGATVEVSPLPSPISRWLPRTSGNGIGKMIAKAKQYINEQYASQVYPFYRDKLSNKYPFKANALNDVSLSDFEEFFRVGGILDQFQTEYIAPFVTTNPVNKEYKLKRVDGATISVSPQFMEAVYQAREIRKRLFNSRGDTLNASIFIRPNVLGKNLENMSFQYDENMIVYEHGPIKSRKIVWPSESGNSDSKFQMVDLENNTVASLSAQGQWALLKLIGKMQTFSNPPEEVRIEFTNKEYKGSYIIGGTSAKAFGPESPLKKFKLNGRI